MLGHSLTSCQTVTQLVLQCVLHSKTLIHLMVKITNLICFNQLHNYCRKGTYTDCRIAHRLIESFSMNNFDFIMRNLFHNLLKSLLRGSFWFNVRLISYLNIGCAAAYPRLPSVKRGRLISLLRAGLPSNGSKTLRKYWLKKLS